MLHYDFAEGAVLLLNKPQGWTSFDVVGKIRKTIRIPRLKVGHAGTLDPLATGLLIVCTGKATKTIDSYQGQAKTYEGTFVLGATTPSFDMESEINERYPVSHIDGLSLAQSALGFVGLIQQVGPSYSALRVNGERAYEIARRGEAVVLKAREVLVESFELDSSRFPEIDFKVVCSKGTYIRSLVSDLGHAVGSGAYLSRLVRTAIGTYRLDDAWEIDSLVKVIREQAVTV